MGYDFSKSLFKGEQILWTGESSPQTPPADKYRTRAARLWSIISFAIGAFIFAAAFVHRYTGTDLAGTLFLAAVFAVIGAALWRSSIRYTREYYCLTDGQRTAPSRSSGQRTGRRIHTDTKRKSRRGYAEKETAQKTGKDAQAAGEDKQEKWILDITN